tara:strand:- start:277 stop:936 length:660 start_codon:yes stop_codon:yes gene_type:complete
MASHSRDKSYPHWSEKYRYVTSWCNQQFPKFDADKIIECLKNKDPTLTESPDEIKKRWKNIATYGKKVHKQIEDYYNEISVTNPTEEYKQFLLFIKEYPDWEPLRSEWKIYDERFRICGCIDMVYKLPNGNIVLCDWKTSKEIKKENSFESGLTECVKHMPNCNFSTYSLQLNYYKFMLEELYELEVEKMYIVSLLKDKWTVDDVPDLNSEVRSLNTLL